jgi:hypothetical protein
MSILPLDTSLAIAYPTFAMLSMRHYPARWNAGNIALVGLDASSRNPLMMSIFAVHGRISIQTPSINTAPAADRLSRKIYLFGTPLADTPASGARFCNIDQLCGL